MDIYDLINMKKDMFINQHSLENINNDDSYQCESSDTLENEYISTLSENFELLLENVNLKLFRYSSEDYIYDLLEESECWDITEEGVIGAVADGIKKIISAIISLIGKILQFIGSIFSKILSVFDRGSSEMDKVDKTLNEYNDAVKKANNVGIDTQEKVRKKIDEIERKYDFFNEDKRKARSEEIKQKADADFKKEISKIKAEGEAKKKELNDKIKKDKEELENAKKEQERVMREKIEKAKQEFEKNKEEEERKKEAEQRIKKARTDKARDKAATYGHNKNSKFDLSLGPQSLDSLYNKFGSEIKVKYPIYKLPDSKKADQIRNYSLSYWETPIDYHIYRKDYSNPNRNMYEERLNKVLNYIKCNNIQEVNTRYKQIAREIFIKDDDNTEKSINKIPLEIIKYYSVKSNDIKAKLSTYKDVSERKLADKQKSLKSLENGYEKGEYEGKVLNSAEKKELAKGLSLMRTFINAFGTFLSELFRTGVYATTNCINICKLLTKKLYKVQSEYAK